MDYKVQISNIKNSMVLKGVTKDSQSYVIYNLLQGTNYDFVMYFVENNFDIELIEKELKFYSDEMEIIKFPEWNIIPYDINSPSVNIQMERMKSLYKLLNYKELYQNKKVVFLISKNSIAQKIINRNDYKFVNFNVGDKISINEFRKILEENGYTDMEFVVDAGNYSCNNNIIDLITFENVPYRIFLQNGILKEIKSFDVNSQITFGNYDNVLILPIKEVILSKSNIENFRQNYRNNFGTQQLDDKNGLYEEVSNCIYHNGCENWLTLFYSNKLETIFEYLPLHSLFVYNINIVDKIKDFIEQINKFYNLRISNKLDIYNPIHIDELYLNFEEIKNKLDSKINIIFDSENKIKNERQMDLDFKSIPQFYENNKEIIPELIKFLDR